MTTSSFTHAHEQAIRLLLGRTTTRFECATADALWAAYEASRGSAQTFKAVSAATGAGKTMGAIALMGALFPARTAIVIRELKEAHEAIAGSTFAEMPGLGHFPMSEDPEKFLHFLLPVLDRIRGAG